MTKSVYVISHTLNMDSNIDGGLRDEWNYYFFLISRYNF